MDRDAAGDQHIRHELRAVTLLRSPLTAQNCDSVTGFPGALEPLDAVMEGGTLSTCPIVHSPLLVVAVRVIGPPAEFAAHKDVSDTACLKCGGELVLGILRAVARPRH